jgi:lipoprotein-anchoring transpeptidase ErfK/SrfK
MCELDRRGSVLRATISVLVIGFALAGSIGSATAQYPPPQPPPLGYPLPAPYSYPAGPPRHPGAYPYGDAGVPYEDPDGQLYAPNSGPPASYPPPAYPAYPYSASPPSQVRGTVVAALPPEYQPERGPIELLPQFYRTVVDYPTVEQPGTIIIDTPNTYLYLTLGHAWQGNSLRDWCGS